MSGFEPVSHAADIGFKVRGNSLEELFSNAAWAIASHLVEISDGVPDQTIFVQLKAETLEELLAKWLTEVVFLFKTQSLVGLGFRVVRCDLKNFTATIHGVQWNSDKQPLKAQIKKVTFHKTVITQKENQFEAEVVLDV